MPFGVTDVVTSRLQFVTSAQRKKKSFSKLCAEHGISRKAGYKWIKRFQELGLKGLEDRSHARRGQRHAYGAAVVRLVLRARDQHPTFGPRKLLTLLESKHPALLLPAPSTIGDILKRNGRIRVRRRCRRRFAPSVHPLATAERPNAVWCMDFKGWFKVGDGSKCDPFTVTDSYSRKLLCCTHVDSQSFDEVQPLLMELFKQHGLPDAILSDNGPPFATSAVAGVSKLGLWFIQLGIRHIRIQPGKPQQNGRHERMHRTLQEFIDINPQPDLRRQQQELERFRYEFNHERPHEALDMKTPASVYKPSDRKLPTSLPAFEYPARMPVRTVRNDGTIKWKGRNPFVSQTLSKHRIAIDEKTLQVFLGQTPIAVLDEENNKLMPL